jgi:hypothetical protein
MSSSAVTSNSFQWGCSATLLIGGAITLAIGAIAYHHIGAFAHMEQMKGVMMMGVGGGVFFLGAAFIAIKKYSTPSPLSLITFHFGYNQEPDSFTYKGKTFVLYDLKDTQGKSVADWAVDNNDFSFWSFKIFIKDTFKKEDLHLVCNRSGKVISYTPQDPEFFTLLDILDPEEK